MEDFDIQQFIKEALASGDSQQISKAIAELMSGRLKTMPSFEHYVKQLNPKKHEIMDPSIRKDKMVNVDPESPDYGSTRSIMLSEDGAVPERFKIEKVARIAIAFQKLIVKRAVGITFGNPVKYKATPESEEEKALYAAIIRVLKENKEPSLNRKAARQVYGLTEVAERWYVVEGSEEHTNYSENPTKMKLKVQIFAPEFGDRLYPYFNEQRDMVAFSRAFSKKDADGREHSFFETYTAEMIYMWQTDGGNVASAVSNGGWKLIEGYPKVNPHGKIPVIYGCQEEPEYADVESLISRLENLLSNFADTNDYHASPKIIVKGHVNSFCKKGEAGAVLELDPDASAEYLSWNQAPDAVKTEYENLNKLIHAVSQTPDLSWESVKGLAVSGVALRLMFMDAILKVKDKEEIWLDYLVRRVNLLKTMLGQIDVNSFGDAVSSLFVEPEIVPYIVVDETERANMELALSGNKQLKSRRSAMQSLGIDNIDEEINIIEDEESGEQMFQQFEPTLA